MRPDAIYMHRALELAVNGLGSVSPNPLVGCVVVCDNKMIGEGWHMQYGGPHAEVNAINSVLDKPALKDSVVYVTLEPCSHYGKTPPCADLLIQCKVKGAIICNADVNPLVSGQGVAKLRNAGIDVEENFLSEVGEEMNRRFFTFFRKGRPYIILKWAQTTDGFIARENFESKWISNELSRKLVHKWRGEEDAVMVGGNTAHYDNPRLNVRSWEGKDPVRIVIDRKLRLSKNMNLLDGSQKTIVYNMLENHMMDNLEYVKLPEENFLQGLFSDLYHKRIQSVMVEGGAALMNELIGLNLWDEARVFRSDIVFGKGIAAPKLPIAEVSVEDILGDSLFFYRNR